MDFLCCLYNGDHAPSGSPHRTSTIITEKPTLHPPINSTIEETAETIIDILLCAEKPGALLSAQLDDAVSVNGWSEWLAQNILKKLEDVLRDEREEMGPAMAEAYEQACKAAEITFSNLFEYAHEHPAEIVATVLLSVVAFGVLVRLIPGVLELLGFSELGPVTGEFHYLGIEMAIIITSFPFTRYFRFLVAIYVSRICSRGVSFLILPETSYEMGKGQRCGSQNESYFVINAEYKGDMRVV